MNIDQILKNQHKRMVLRWSEPMERMNEGIITQKSEETD